MGRAALWPPIHRDEASSVEFFVFVCIVTDDSTVVIELVHLGLLVLENAHDGTGESHPQYSFSISFAWS